MEEWFVITVFIRRLVISSCSRLFCTSFEAPSSLTYMQIFSLYTTENTAHLYYRDQLCFCLCSENNTKPTNAKVVDNWSERFQFQLFFWWSFGLISAFGNKTRCDFKPKLKLSAVNCMVELMLIACKINVSVITETRRKSDPGVKHLLRAPS